MAGTDIALTMDIADPCRHNAKPIDEAWIDAAFEKCAAHAVKRLL
ncbi:MAG: hypothetical protein V2A58_10390 [Planctomycetota bacterium]